MGYSEIHCNFCGVSFNISRLRQMGESREAAWSASGYANSYVEWASTDCGEASGCRAVERFGDFNPIPRYRLPTPPHSPEADDDDDDDDDESYRNDSPSEVDPYEFESDDDLIATDTEDTNSEDDLPIGDWPGSSHAENPAGSNQIELTFLLQDPSPPRERVVPVPLPETPNGWTPKLEHICGSRCVSERAYHGNTISVEEMQGCRTFQALLPKDEDWDSEEDDEEFERDSDFFLSGISDKVPSQHNDYPEVTPARHGIREAIANDFVFHRTLESPGLPFHPACFDLFKRASKTDLGKIDINGLMEWRSQLAPYGPWSAFELHPAVKRGRERWWRHYAGDEWLAANPIHVPRLPIILQSAMSEVPLDPHSNVFAPSHPPSQTSRVTDPFWRLPQELRDEILNYLEGDDMLPLRLSSRAFNRIPLGYFRRLIQREMPYLYEVWSNDPPSAWSMVNQRVMEDYEMAEAQWYEELSRLREIIEDEMPEMLDDWQAAEPRYRDLHPRPGLQTRIVTLVPERMNWFQLYSDIRIAFQKGQLKGLQNRERIWTHVSKIVSQIKGLRQEGKIAAGR